MRDMSAHPFSCWKLASRLHLIDSMHTIWSQLKMPTHICHVCNHRGQLLAHRHRYTTVSWVAQHARCNQERNKTFFLMKRSLVSTDLMNTNTIGNISDEDAPPVLTDTVVAADTFCVLSFQQTKKQNLVSSQGQSAGRCMKLNWKRFLSFLYHFYRKDLIFM